MLTPNVSSLAGAFDDGHHHDLQICSISAAS